MTQHLSRLQPGAACLPGRARSSLPNTNFIFRVLSRGCGLGRVGAKAGATRPFDTAMANGGRFFSFRLPSSFPRLSLGAGRQSRALKSLQGTVPAIRVTGLGGP